MNRSIRVAAGLLIALPVLAAAQAIGPGFELERSGRYADAANVYLTTIHTDPVNIPALLGLERTLFVLNRMPELLPLVQAARARLPDNVALRSLELRVYAALNEPDSVEAIARRWAGTAPAHVRLRLARRPPRGGPAPRRAARRPIANGGSRWSIIGCSRMRDGPTLPAGRRSAAKGRSRSSWPSSSSGRTTGRRGRPSGPPRAPKDPRANPTP